MHRPLTTRCLSLICRFALLVVRVVGQSVFLNCEDQIVRLQI